MDEVRNQLDGRTDRQTDGQWLLALSVVLSMLACRGEERVSDDYGAPVRQSVSPSVRQSSPSVRQIDSILPLEEEIRRFRVAVPEVPATLAGGERSRDALVRRWVRSVETRDSVDLTAILLTAAEYITFYYPESPYTTAPYRQAPGLRWSLMMASSSQGSTRVWQRHAGQPLGFSGYRCDAEPEMMGANRIWKNCEVSVRTDGGVRSIRLFGPIIERDGEFKFLTYASDY